MYDKGRHDSHTRQHQRARYHLRKGIACEALKVKVTGQQSVDCVGRPMLYANEMAERHGITTIERWANGMDARVANRPLKIWCKRCKSEGKEPFQLLPHFHNQGDCDGGDGEK